MTTRLLLVCLLSACVTAPVTNPPLGPTSTGPTTTGASGDDPSATGPDNTVQPKPPRLTRLRMNGVAAAAGADPEESFQFYDNDLKAQCSFTAINDDGDWRCVPDPSYSVRYSDASCTKALMFFRSSCGRKTPTYALQFMKSDHPFHRIWGMRDDLFKVGSQIEKPATLYKYDPYTSSCDQVAEPPKGDAYALTPDDGAVLAHAKFEYKKGTSGRVGQARVVPDDAGPIADYFIGAAYDFTASFPCATDVSGECELSVSTARPAFSDAQCMNDVLTTTSTRDLIRDPDGNIRRVTASQQKTVYDDTTGMCVASASTKRVLTLGATIEQAAGSVKVVGTGRVRDRRVEIDGLSFFAEHIDTQDANKPCFATWAVDDKVRCVPAKVWVRRVYTDASCQTAVLAGDADGETPDYATIWDTCDEDGWTIVNVGAKSAHVGALYQLNAFAECDEIPDTATDYLLDRYEIGSTVAPSTFGEMP